MNPRAMISITLTTATKDSLLLWSIVKSSYHSHLYDPAHVRDGPSILIWKSSEVEQWCKDNLKREPNIIPCWSFTQSDYAMLNFACDNDALLFKMRWL